MYKFADFAPKLFLNDDCGAMQKSANIVDPEKVNAASRILTCKIWLRYSRERALLKFARSSGAQQVLQNKDQLAADDYAFYDAVQKGKLPEDVENAFYGCLVERYKIHTPEPLDIDLRIMLCLF